MCVRESVCEYGIWFKSSLCMSFSAIFHMFSNKQGHLHAKRANYILKGANHAALLCYMCKKQSGFTWERVMSGRAGALRTNTLRIWLWTWMYLYNSPRGQSEWGHYQCCHHSCGSIKWKYKDKIKSLISKLNNLSRILILIDF